MNPLLKGGTPSECANRIFSHQKEKTLKLLEGNKLPAITFSDVLNGQGAITVTEGSTVTEEKLYCFDLKNKECSCEWSQKHFLGRCCKHLLVVAIVLDDSSKHGMVDADGPLEACVPPEWDVLCMKHITWTESLRRNTDGLLYRMASLANIISSHSQPSSFIRINVADTDKNALLAVLHARARTLGKTVVLNGGSEDEISRASDSSNSAPATTPVSTSEPAAQDFSQAPAESSVVEDMVSTAGPSIPATVLAALDLLPLDAITAYLKKRTASDSQEEVTLTKAKWTRNVCSRYGTKTTVERCRKAKRTVPRFWSIVQRKKGQAPYADDKATQLNALREMCPEETRMMFAQSKRSGSVSDLTASQRRRRDNEEASQDLHPASKNSRTALQISSLMPDGWPESSFNLPHPVRR
jgi:hypothetical protein